MIYHETDSGVLYQGDCLDIMKTLPENSVDAVVTDPPYGLSFMGKKWDYAVPSVEIWAECLRVLKPGGYLLSFAGTRTQHRMACGIEDAGFEIRDMIAWVYGSGFPKSLDVGKAIDKMQGTYKQGAPSPNSRQSGESPSGCYGVGVQTKTMPNPQHPLAKHWDGYGTALKPALEPITVARKPISGTVAENVLKWGTGAIDIDGCRVEYQSEQDKVSMYRPESRGGLPNEFNACKIIQSKPSTHGRFPANLIHDGSDEVLGLFPETKGSPQPRTNKGSGNVCYGTYNKVTTQNDSWGDSGSAARFFYCAKASRAERNKGLDSILTVKYDALKTIERSKWKDANMELAALLQKVMSELAPVSFSTAECGESIMGRCHKDTLSITLTGISKITTSQILPLLTPLLTSAFIQVANYETEHGGSPAKSAESLSPLTQNTISGKTEYPLGVVNAVSQMLSTIKDGENWQPLTNIHATVKPIALMEYLVKLVAREGYTVLDPFLGSGTTAIACVKQGRRYIGCEMDKDYCEIAARRIDAELEQTEIELCGY